MASKKVRIALCFLITLIIGSLFWAQHKLDSYLNTTRVEQTMLFTVDSGSHYSRLGNTLLTAKIIPDLSWWKALGKLHPELTRIKSGTYQFKQGFTLKDILITINTGIEYQFSITFVEGGTFNEWLQILQNAPYIKPLQEGEQQIAERLGSPHEKLEGLLFPETYHYTAGMSAYQLIEKSYQHQQHLMEKLWAERDKDLPFKTLYEALIMASIVEKESGLSEDRDKIASVFVNRMRIGMRLQTDPTVIYGMGDRYDGRIRSKDLIEDTVYNTYRIDGLPPTPIAMPSEAALHATLHPAATKYLYFVSKGDGTSYFSKNLQEHNQAVRKYILGK
ncbi:MAG: endolytic transglycosylase MltG [Psychromonas sp.]